MGKRRGNKQGHARQRPDGRWEWQLSLPNGHRRSVYGLSYEACRIAAAEEQAKIDAGLPLGGPVTVATWCTAWLANTRERIRPGTYHTYAVAVNKHIIPALGRIKLTKLTAERLERFYADLLAGGLSRSSVHHVHVILGTALEKALKRGHVARNVQRLADPPSVPEYKPRPLTPEEAHRLLAAAADDRFEALYYLLFCTGLRLGEALALRWSGVDFKAGAITVAGSLQRRPGSGLVILETKTKRSRRTVSVAPAALEALRRRRARQREEKLAVRPVWHDTGLVFTTETGTAISPENIRRRSWYPLLARIGLADVQEWEETVVRRGKEKTVTRRKITPRVRLHDARHSAAVMLLKGAVPVVVVSQLLGHSRTSTTLDVYAKYVDNLTSPAAAKLQELLADQK